MGLEVATLAYIAMASSALSAGVQYVGAQRQAKAQEYAADAALAQAEVNSKIAFQRRQAESQDAAYQANVAEYNKQAALAEFGREELAFTNEVEGLQASFINNAFSTKGSFEDIFNSQEGSFNLAAAKLSSGYSEKTFQFGEQAGLSTESAKRSISLGQYEASNVLAAGANTATSYRNQASATRFGAIGGLIGSAGSMAGSAAYYKHEKIIP
jgi:hypothetical protein